MKCRTHPNGHRRELGVPGVAEPAALLGAAADSLLVEKRKFANVTVAVALSEGRDARMSGSLDCGWSLAPGALEHTTWAAREAIEQADVILGYKTYVALVAGLASHIPRETSGMRQ